MHGAALAHAVTLQVLSVIPVRAQSLISGPATMLLSSGRLAHRAQLCAAGQARTSMTRLAPVPVAHAECCARPTLAMAQDSKEPVVRAFGQHQHI